MSESNTSRLTQAAAWRVRLTEHDLESCPELSAWLAEDALNAVAWERVQRDWALFGEHASSPELLELRSEALAHANEAGQYRWIRSRRLAFTRRLSLAAGILILAVGGLLAWMAQPDVYTTRAGERRIVKLADGSRVVLDSHSAVKVKYSTHARELILAEGQARFDVAHDSERPFSVSAGGHKITAMGTSFNVDLFGPSLLVTLFEGRVEVFSAPSDELTRVAPASASIRLDSGEQVVFSPQAPPRVARVDPEQASAWENGDVMSDNDLLTTIVPRINRYTQHAIVIGDKATGELRISGVFHTGETEGFVSTLVAYHLPIRVEKRLDGTTLLTHLPTTVTAPRFPSNSDQSRPRE